ncbi:hypothetical protein GJAV_G00269440 [Gymnothorax javanicus]|nr:hypothetical protein GJAV_G00269440 [Gymnothorax javanicus]
MGKSSVFIKQMAAIPGSSAHCHGGRAKEDYGLGGPGRISESTRAITNLVHEDPGLSAEDAPDAAYRKYTEQIIAQRFDHVKTESDVEKLEKRINCGQIEEVISQAETELSLARKMLDWKPWEPLVEEPPPNQWKWPI